MKQKLQKQSSLALILTTITILAQSAWADYIPLPIKWSQPIGFTNFGGSQRIIGRDRLSTDPSGTIRADDFLCTDLQPIVAVRWWGSYIGEGPATTPGPRPVTPPGAIPFSISFHESTQNFVPTNIHPFSLPVGNPLYLQHAGAQEEFVGVDQAGDWVYRYDAFLPTPFFQQGTAANPREYFIDISWFGIVGGNPTNNWGWHESPFGKLDYPAVSFTGHGGPWYNDPPHDLAFELMTIPEPGVGAILGGGIVLLLARRRAKIRQ